MVKSQKAHRFSEDEVKFLALLAGAGTAFLVVFGGYFHPVVGYGILGVLFGFVWPVGSWRWGVWLSIPICIFIGLKMMMSAADFFPILIIVLVIFIQSLLFACIGAYVGAYLGAWFARCMNQSNHFPSIRQAIWLLVLAELLMIVLSIFVGILGSFTFVFIAPVAIGLILIWGFKKANAPFKEVFPLVPIRISLLFPMSLAVIGMSILLSEMDNLFRAVLPIPTEFADFFMKFVMRRTWDSIVGGVVIAPLTEELLFRGLILHGFLSYYTARKSVLASAILFGLFHLNPWQFLGATILGVLFAWWFVQTRSLLPCLFGHAMNNALPLILIGIFHLEIQGLTSEPTKIVFQPLWLDLVGLLLAGLGVWLVYAKAVKRH